MSIDRSEMEKIAHLARLNISEENIAATTTSLSEVLDFVNQLQSVDTSEITPLAHPLDTVQRLRADEVTEQNQRDALQANAPQAEEGLFLVPKVVE